MCKKDKAQGKQCNKGQGNNYKQGKMCDKQANKSCDKRKWGGKGHQFMRNLYYTFKHLDLKKSDWSDIKIAMNSYRSDMRKIPMATPIKSIQGGKLDRKLFLSTHPMHKKLAAQADLLETILLVLNSDQKKEICYANGSKSISKPTSPTTR